MKETIEIVTRFKSPVMTAEQYINFSKQVLIKLKSFNSIFENIHSWGGKTNSWTRIERDFSYFDSTIFDHIYDKDINYKNQDNQKGFFPTSISWVGYSNSYSNVKKTSEEKYSISIGAGDENGTGFINIKLPKLNEFYRVDFIKLLIKNILEIVPLSSAYAFTDSLFDQVVDFDKAYDIQIGWINFFSEKHIKDHIPKTISSTIENCGLFFWITDEIAHPSTNNINTAKTLRDHLGELNYLN